MPEKYILCLSEENDGDTLNIQVEGTLPRKGEEIRVIPTNPSEQRYYKVTRILHTLLEVKIDSETVQRTGRAEFPQVYARRKETNQIRLDS